MKPTERYRIIEGRGNGERIIGGVNLIKVCACVRYHGKAP
jgi:hypothetical protein